MTDQSKCTDFTRTRYAMYATVARSVYLRFVDEYRPLVCAGPREAPWVTDISVFEITVIAKPRFVTRVSGYPRE